MANFYGKTESEIAKVLVTLVSMTYAPTAT
jgi:hypothetical protein